MEAKGADHDLIEALNKGDEETIKFKLLEANEAKLREEGRLRELPGRRVLRRDVGKPCNFMGSDGCVYRGMIVAVGKGIATISYAIPNRKGAFTSHLDLDAQKNKLRFL
jgi:hypothetical protein